MYNARVVEVLIASPSDVPTERDMASNVIHRWNTVNSRSREIVILPVRWETHATSDLGGRAQQLINERVAKGCDIVVGIFWTRLGTPTGDSESGSAEEIEEQVKAGRPAMAFFSNFPVVPSSIDKDQYDRLQSFKKKLQSSGLTWDYENPADFERLFAHQLQLILNDHPYFKNDATSRTSEPNRPTPTRPNLTSRAIDILSAAVKTGQILCVRTMAGKVVQTGGQNFGSSDAREAAEVDHALEELENGGYITTSGPRQIFQVTKTGYDTIDALI